MGRQDAMKCENAPWWGLRAHWTRGLKSPVSVTLCRGFYEFFDTLQGTLLCICLVVPQRLMRKSAQIPTGFQWQDKDRNFTSQKSTRGIVRASTSERGEPFQVSRRDPTTTRKAPQRIARPTIGCDIIHQAYRVGCRCQHCQLRNGAALSRNLRDMHGRAALLKRTCPPEPQIARFRNCPKQWASCIRYQFRTQRFCLQHISRAFQSTLVGELTWTKVDKENLLVLFLNMLTERPPCRSRRIEETLQLLGMCRGEL